MKLDSSKRALEGHKIFPYIAWGLIITFSLCVYLLVLELQETKREIEQRYKDMETQFSQPIPNKHDHTDQQTT